MSEKIFFGIDLGTTNSVISFIDQAGLPTVVPNQDADGDITPSVVFIEENGSPVVGQAAKDVAPLYPDRVVTLVKREMGREREWTIGGQSFTPESLSAIILRRLGANAEAHCGQEVKNVVVTVPAYFGMLERGATRDAGRIAGFDNIGIVPEPVAAALHYDVVADADGKTILVYDLGGGTFDTTVIAIESGSIEVLCTDGDSQLGGADWDERLAALILRRFKAEAELGDEDPEDNEHFMRELLTMAEDVKKGLSRAQSRPVAPRLGQIGARFDVTREEFEEATADLLDATIDCTRRTMAYLAEHHPGRAIDEVLLVGGATRMPAVADRLETELEQRPRLHDPDLAVAKGAARYALGQAVWDWGGEASAEPTTERIAARAEELEASTGISAATIRDIAGKRVITVLPKAFGVRLVDTEKPGWMDDVDGASYIEHLVHANDALPSGPHLRELGTVVDGQTQIEIELYEQAGAVEKPDLAYNNAIDHDSGLVTGIPPGPAGTPINISMRIDEEGLLSLTATEPQTGTELTINVRIKILDDAQVEAARRQITALTVKG
ncbi:Hsp70 family protein [Phytomonospora endophytica]|uniref:Molecular chaperone DnaK (HSP70) n=1 Tax=Phytomonospora endophytica TaxID=714109 RepID=A0A841FL17_9ACTN|nr:Hsp70 family protein [Phytomonospora endophytica]MBB6036856.1 molecular chaperone DnaK (HSP70) [Phytomonospora endophytica]GIG68110.1 molecular chaperone DnaK [Phytomonospora endophytica]